MGLEQSKIPYNVENPRRVRDLKTFHQIYQEYKALANGNFELEVFGNFTALEFVTFASMAPRIETIMNNPRRLDELKKYWKSWFFIYNKWTELIEAELCADLPIKNKRITLQPGDIGRFPLPKEFDFDCERPLNPITCDWEVRFYYKNGQTMTESCHRLDNGMDCGDFVFNNPNNIVRCEINEYEPPDQKDGAAELWDFISEVNDPRCFALIDQPETIIDFIEKCFPQAADKQPE